MAGLDEILTATYRKDLASLRQLTRDEVNRQDDDGRTPLMHAVLADDADPAVIALLLERGADVNAADDDQRWTALHFAARDQKASIVRALLRAGANIDATDAVGDTPLWHSVMTAGSDLAVVRDLVRNGADPGMRNRYGVSPIDLCRTAGRDDILALLQGTAE